MTPHILSRVPILGKFVDERFLEYRFLIDHVWSWDLVAVAVAIVAVKLALMTWYRMTG